MTVSGCRTAHPLPQTTWLADPRMRLQITTGGDTVLQVRGGQTQSLGSGVFQAGMARAEVALYQGNSILSIVNEPLGNTAGAYTDTLAIRKTVVDGSGNKTLYNLVQMLDAEIRLVPQLSTGMVRVGYQVGTITAQNNEPNFYGANFQASWWRGLHGGCEHQHGRMCCHGTDALRPALAGRRHERALLQLQRDAAPGALPRGRFLRAAPWHGDQRPRLRGEQHVRRLQPVPQLEEAHQGRHAVPVRRIGQHRQRPHPVVRTADGQCPLAPGARFSHASSAATGC